MYSIVIFFSRKLRRSNTFLAIFLFAYVFLFTLHGITRHSNNYELGVYNLALTYEAFYEAFFKRAEITKLARRV